MPENLLDGLLPDSADLLGKYFTRWW